MAIQDRLVRIGGKGYSILRGGGGGVAPGGGSSHTKDVCFAAVFLNLLCSVRIVDMALPLSVLAYGLLVDMPRRHYSPGASLSGGSGGRGEVWE